MALPAWATPWTWSLLWTGIVLGFIGVNGLFGIWLERKVSGRIQRRVGPTRVGAPFGVLQTVADAIKLFSKEDVMPAGADKWVWYLAPVVIFVPATLMFAVIPMGPNLIIADINVGVLFILGVTSFTLLADFMAGWGSNNKYSLIGALRAGAQLMSYEIPMALSLISVVMVAGSLSLQDIVAAQSDVWFIFPQFVAFIVFFISMMAEASRTPFDLAEAESELVAGFNTEFSALRWGMFFLVEYGALFAWSAITVSLFFGGWQGPLLPPIVWFILKTYAVVMLVMWIGWTVPRVRIDQLLDLGWKFLIPVSLINIFVTGIVMVL